MDKFEKISVQLEKAKKEIRETPYHKGTQHYIGLLRAKVAKLEDQLWTTGHGGGGLGFGVKKQGDATVVLIGFPSVGKSTLLNSLTSAHAKTAAYSFTTVTAIPGMLKHNGALIQLIDLPGFLMGASLGKGHGREILSVARNADLLLLVLDIQKPQQLEQIKKELKDSDIGNDYLVVGNKGDLIKRHSEASAEESHEILRFAQHDIVIISAQNKAGLEDLKEAIWQKLKLIRVYLKKSSAYSQKSSAYLKPENGKTDLVKPLILKEGQTVLEAMEKISLELVDLVKEAKVWGKSAKFPGQIVSLAHLLQDEDILTIIT